MDITKKLIAIAKLIGVNFTLKSRPISLAERLLGSTDDASALIARDSFELQPGPTSYLRVITPMNDLLILLDLGGIERVPAPSRRTSRKVSLKVKRLLSKLSKLSKPLDVLLKRIRSGKSVETLAHYLKVKRTPRSAERTNRLSCS